MVNLREILRVTDWKALCFGVLLYIILIYCNLHSKLTQSLFISPNCTEGHESEAQWPELCTQNNSYISIFPHKNIVA